MMWFHSSFLRQLSSPRDVLKGLVTLEKNTSLSSILDRFNKLFCQIITVSFSKHKFYQVCPVLLIIFFQRRHKLACMGPITLNGARVSPSRRIYECLLIVYGLMDIAFTYKRGEKHDLYTYLCVLPSRSLYPLQQSVVTIGPGRTYFLIISCNVSVLNG